MTDHVTRNLRGRRDPIGLRPAAPAPLRPTDGQRTRTLELCDDCYQSIAGHVNPEAPQTPLCAPVSRSTPGNVATQPENSEGHQEVQP